MSDKDRINKLVERGSITWDEFRSLTMNSYDRAEVYPKLTTSALYRLVEEHILPNCSAPKSVVPATYDQALVHVLAPLLIKKLKEQQNLKRVGTAVGIMNEEDKFLVGFHEKFQGWCFPGGKVNGDEYCRDCAIREVREETGLELATCELVGETEENLLGCITKYYVGRPVDCSALSTPEPHKQHSWEWIGSEDLRKWKLHFEPARIIIRDWPNVGF